jgi:SAM-dependent methyltransferase
MRNGQYWAESRFVLRGGRLKASRDPREVMVGSRLMVDLVAARCTDAIRAHAGGRLLDLGCGKAPLFGLYREFAGEITCVDWSGTLHGGEYVDLEADLSLDLPLPDAGFDTIILSDVLEHIPEPDRLWREMYRILSPGGRLILNVPFYYGLHEKPLDYFRYTEYALRRFADSAGFEIVSLERIGGVPEIMADLVAKQLQAAPLVGRPLATLVQWSTLVFVRSPLGRRLSARTSRSFPFGYFMVAAKR